MNFTAYPYSRIPTLCPKLLKNMAFTNSLRNKTLPPQLVAFVLAKFSLGKYRNWERRESH